MNPAPADFSSASSDAVLARAAQRGEKRAFVEIVARHQALVCGVALGVLGDFAASEDAAQEAFLTAWRKIHELREPEKLRPWLAQIARNAALGHLRRAKGRREEELAEAEPAGGAADEPAPDALAVSGEEAALVREALSRLPETYRLPLVLFYRQEQSVREVAAALELSEDAVKQRLARGRELLRERLSGVVETALCRTQPGAVFTMAIAAAIGALMAPAAIAGSVFAAAAAGSAASTASAVSASTLSTTTTTTTAAAMSTAKFSAAAALVAAACLPLGYAVHFGWEKPAAAPLAAVAQPPAASAAAAPDFPDSELFAEWVRLHEEHGHDAAAMPVLFQAISEIKDAFRRRAFRAALVAEWAQVDPASGLDFFLGKNGNSDAAKQLFLDWLAREPQAAMAALLARGGEGNTFAGGADILPEIARHAPGRVAEIAAQLPENKDHWRHPVADAFAILAEKDLASARAAAESLTGPRRNEALSGVAKAWARQDFEAAVAWVKTLPADTDQNGILRDALTGLAKADPLKALENAGLVPPGGRESYFADTTVARLLKVAGEEHFDAVSDWLRDHPGRFSHEDMMGLANVVTDRLNADPAAFLSEHAARGTLQTLGPALNSALLNDAKPQQAAVWEWLKTQPDSEAVRELSRFVLSSAGYQNPALALAIAKELPDTPEGQAQIDALAQSMLNGGSNLSRLDNLLAQSSGRLHSQLITNAFRYMNPDALGEPATWMGRLQEVPEAERPAASANLAASWAVKNPENAAAWAMSLPAEAGRSGALSNIATVWMKSDSFAASEWIAQLPPGSDRDGAVRTLVGEIASDAPDEAWQWAVGIGDATLRLQAAQQSLAPLAARDPAEARRWIDTSALAEGEKQTLRQAVEAAAPGQR